MPVGGVGTADVDDNPASVKEAVADLPRAWQPRSVTFVDVLETRGGKTVRGTEAMSEHRQPRVALVTGGSRGLGAGLVEAFLDAGYCVETCARTDHR